MRLALVAFALLLSGCASSASPASQVSRAALPAPPGALPGAAPLAPSNGSWSVEGVFHGNLTGAGQQAVVVARVPEGGSTCPLPGLTFEAPRGVGALVATLDVAPGAVGHMTFELYPPKGGAVFPNGTQSVGPANVHLDMDDHVQIAVAGAAPGTWLVGLKPQGAFHGAYALRVAASGEGVTPAPFEIGEFC